MRTRRLAQVGISAAIVLTGASLRSVGLQDKTATSVPSRDAILRGAARAAILPNYADLAKSCAELAAAGKRLAGEPSATTLQGAQDAWRRALTAFKRAQTMPAGPLADHGYAASMHFWPIRPQSVEKLLREDKPLDASAIESLGATVTGFATLEYLLFAPDPERTLLGEGGARRRGYVAALAADLAGKAAQVDREWRVPGTGYAARFTAGGQASLNLLVNHLLLAIEVPTDGRLRTAIALHSSNMLKPELVEGAPSGVSQSTLLETLRACREIYRGEPGASLAAYLEKHAPELQRRLAAQFDQTIGAIESIGVPLESAVLMKKSAVVKAYEECKILEALVKVELVSTLGVALTFSAQDGD